MSTIVKTGWLHDKEGNKFAPKTLTSQVQTSDGTLIEDKIQADLDAVKDEILSNVSIDVDGTLSSTSENPVQNRVINEEFDAVKADISALETTVGGKLDASIASSSYETKIDAQSKLDTAKSYTDSKTNGLASTSSVNTSISTHDTSTSAHNDIRALINDLSTAVNDFLDVDDTTADQLSEVLMLIENNKGTLESLTSSKINVSDIVDNLTTNSTDKVLSAAQGVVIKNLIDALQEAVDGKAASSHTHTISDVTNLQSSLDGKSDVGHTHTVVDITGLTVTATELNYMSGASSNVQNQLDAKVPSTRTINGKALSEDVSLSATDVNAYSKTEIDNLELITVADIDTICGATIQMASEVTF